MGDAGINYVEPVPEEYQNLKVYNDGKKTLYLKFVGGVVVIMDKYPKKGSGMLYRLLPEETMAFSRKGT